MSKMSMPCILPSISRRSRPVACSRSVGTVPGAAPGGRRSCSLLISVTLKDPPKSAQLQRNLVIGRLLSYRLSASDMRRIRQLSGPFLLLCVSSVSFDGYVWNLIPSRETTVERGHWDSILRRAERANERVTAGRSTARLASAGAARRRNMVERERRFGDNGLEPEQRAGVRSVCFGARRRNGLAL